jgi:triosephosphate isomerase
MRRPLVAANWKMNGSLQMARELPAAVRAKLGATLPADVLICPPFTLLKAVAEGLADTGFALGAQNVHAADSGAYTGEVSVAMLRETCCQYVIVGHSERRQLFGEDDATVAAKFAAAKAGGLVPILCVGETLEEREADRTLDVVHRQLDAVLAAHGDTALDGAVLAYEPVWAIGTGRTATPEQAQDVHAALRARCPEGSRAALRILYGGSVKADNAATLFAQPDIDGGLVGGASLNADDFAAICAAPGQEA